VEFIKVHFISHWDSSEGELLYLATEKSGIIIDKIRKWSYLNSEPVPISAGFLCKPYNLSRF